MISLKSILEGESNTDKFTFKQRDASGKWCFAAHDAAHFEYPLKGINRKVCKNKSTKIL